MERPAQKSVPKRLRSSGLSRVMEDAEAKRQQVIDEMLGAAGMVIKKAEVK